nr:MAG TPA: hypothetical protein [Caudoviricetes sp.]
MLALLKGRFTVRYESAIGQLAASFKGKGADTASLVAVTNKIQRLPHSLTAALKGLHQEGLCLVIGQNLLSHIVPIKSLSLYFRIIRNYLVKACSLLQFLDQYLHHFFTYTTYIFEYPVGIRVILCILRHELLGKFHSLVSYILCMSRIAYHHAKLLLELAFSPPLIEILCHKSKF